MQHIHVLEIRPDAVTRSSVVSPYAARYGPDNVARMVLHDFTRAVRHVGPSVSTDMAPEEVAMRAKRIADALRRGERMPVDTAPQLLQAARLIMEGRPFRIRSAGRAALVRAMAPGSWEQQYYANPASGALRRR